MKRAIFTLFSAVVLVGAAPAITLADAATEPRHACGTACQCAEMRTHARVGAAADQGMQPSATAKLTDREEEFMDEVWSAP